MKSLQLADLDRGVEKTRRKLRLGLLNSNSDLFRPPPSILVHLGRQRCSGPAQVFFWREIAVWLKMGDWSPFVAIIFDSTENDDQPVD